VLGGISNSDQALPVRLVLCTPEHEKLEKVSALSGGRGPDCVSRAAPVGGALAATAAAC
jgi:hypothetical protein